MHGESRSGCPPPAIPRPDHRRTGTDGLGKITFRFVYPQTSEANSYKVARLDLSRRQPPVPFEVLQVHGLGSIAQRIGIWSTAAQGFGFHAAVGEFSGHPMESAGIADGKRQ